MKKLQNNISYNKTIYDVRNSDMKDTNSLSVNSDMFFNKINVALYFKIRDTCHQRNNKNFISQHPKINPTKKPNEK